MFPIQSPAIRTGAVEVTARNASAAVQSSFELHHTVCGITTGFVADYETVPAQQSEHHQMT